MDRNITILGFGGSLREGSFSKELLEAGCILEAASDACPKNATFTLFDRIGEFPLYSQDLEADMPEVITEFKNQIKNADAILIATPEYNYSIPGYLKNAIDWATRPYGDNSFDDKPGAIMSASPGRFGGIKAQYALRQTCVFLNLHLLNKPEIAVPGIHEKLEDGKLVDEKTREKIQELMQALCAWTRRIEKK